jgi:hypothetical protein
MPIKTKIKPKLVKKNLFFDQETWDIANFYASQKNTSVAEEIRFSLADFYKKNQFEIKKAQGEKWMAALGSMAKKTDPTKDKDGAIKHNDIYNI